MLSLSKDLLNRTLSLFLTIILVSSLFIGAEVVDAVDEVRIVVGNHNEGEPTNMMIQFLLTEDFVAGDKFTIDFEDDVNLENLLMNNDFVVQWGSNSNNVTGTTLNIGAGVNELSGSLSILTSSFELTLNAGSTTIASGNYLRIFIGPQDGYDLYGFVSGNSYDIVAYPNYNTGGTIFVGTAADELKSIPPDFPGVQPIIMPMDVSSSMLIISKNDIEEVVGSFEVNDNAVTSNDYTANIGVDPFLSLVFNDSSFVFGDMAAGIVSGDTGEMVVSTNAVAGYTLRYRATEFTNGNHDFTRSSVANLVADSWGINLADNTAASKDIGLIPQDDDGNPHATDNLGGGILGVDYGVMSGYSTPDQFSLGVTNELKPILINNGPAENTITITTAALPSTTTPSGVYNAVITMNVYANF